MISIQLFTFFESLRLLLKQLLAKCKLLQNENKFLVKELTLSKNLKIEQELALTQKLNQSYLQKIQGFFIFFEIYSN